MKDYDEKNALSIEKYSQQLIGHSFSEFCPIENQSNKGNLGQIIERYFFHYECNNDSRPDFPMAGVELKVTPFKELKNGKFSAKERLSLTKINYMEVVHEECFEKSHLWEKCKLILLIYYKYIAGIRNIDNKIYYAKMFTPPQQDLLIIKNDYYFIVEKIRQGHAHELSESDTLYLGAAPKAAKNTDKTKQPYSNIPAKPRGFSFKNSYMTYILNNYIVPGKQTYEKITKTPTTNFEQYVTNKINQYKGKSVYELCKEFGIEYKEQSLSTIEKKDGQSSQHKHGTGFPPKNLEAILAYRMLGITSNCAEEFVKAGIVVKTIRIEKTNKIRQNMSFPSFKFQELIDEHWDDSTFGNYLRETRFFFVVYKFDDNNILRLKGSQFWNIPYNDLEEDVHQVWEKTKAVISNGLKIEVKNGRKCNNLPKQSENRVCHVRPHAKNSSDTYELPDGRHYPKQCFWLNNSYIYSQLNESLK